MSGFTKLFSSITESSIWVEDDATLRVWIAMLASCNADGFVAGSVPGFASKARVTVEQMSTAIDKFSSPDPHSRTPDNEGRRVEAIEGGWVVLNYAKYRETRDPEERRRQVREAVRRHRSKKKSGNQPVIKNDYAGLRTAHVSHGKPKKEERRKKTEEKTTSGSALHRADAREVLLFLNKKAGRNFQLDGKPAAKSIGIIEARLKEGATVEDMRSVIARKTHEWADNPHMSANLKPSTLFNGVKYWEYQGQLGTDAGLERRK